MQRLRGPVTIMTGPCPEPDFSVKAALTPARPRAVVENDEYAAFLRRAIGAFGRRIAAGDIDALADAALLSRQLDITIKTAITGLRAARLQLGRHRPAARRHPPGRPAALGR